MSMPGRLLNKVAIVTASTEGIGLAIAQRLAREGAKVVISSRQTNKVNKAVELLRSDNLECHGLVCHVAKKEDRQNLISETVKKYGGIDIVVSNAAVNPSFGPMFSMDENSWDKIFETNVKSTFFLVKEALPHLKKRKGSNILIISSLGAYAPFPLIAPYCVSKTALIGMTKAMGPPCADLGIRVNCIAPGVIKTKFSRALWDGVEETDTTNYKDFFMKRIGKPEEIAGAAAFLCSDDASYMTGETLIVAGGTNSRL
jgi:dehydrogenase/reductase SDR family protein 4